MKIIHFIFSINKKAGGTATYLQLLTSEITKYHDVIIVTGKSDDPLDFPNCKIIEFDFSIFNILLISKRFRFILENEKPDLVHINGIWTPQNYIFQNVSQDLSIPVVLSPHGMLEPYILKRNSWKKKLALFFYQNKALKNAEFIHATAKEELEQIKRLGYNQYTVIIPNGINLSEIKRKNSWPKEKIRNVLFLSRIHPKKGIELLIEAVSIINPSNIKFTISGEGNPDYINGLKKLCQNRGILNLFDFTGGIYGKLKWELFQTADLFVLPTYSENFGIVIAEAMASGLPVITTTGTPWSIINENRCGWWINPTVDELVNAISEALNIRPSQLEEMGKNAIELIEQNFDIKTISKEMSEFYLKVEKNEIPRFKNL